jgi:hypothetical protein
MKSYLAYKTPWSFFIYNIQSIPHFYSAVINSWPLFSKVNSRFLFFCSDQSVAFWYGIGVEGDLLALEYICFYLFWNTPLIHFKISKKITRKIHMYIRAHKIFHEKSNYRLCSVKMIKFGVKNKNFCETCFVFLHRSLKNIGFSRNCTSTHRLSRYTCKYFINFWVWILYTHAWVWVYSVPFVWTWRFAQGTQLVEHFPHPSSIFPSHHTSFFFGFFTARPAACA